MLIIHRQKKLEQHRVHQHIHGYSLIIISWLSPKKFLLEGSWIKYTIFLNLNKCYASIMEIPLKRTETFRVLQRELAPFEICNEPWQQNCGDHNAKSYEKSPFIKAIQKAFQRIKVIRVWYYHFQFILLSSFQRFRKRDVKSNHRCLP